MASAYLIDKVNVSFECTLFTRDDVECIDVNRKTKFCNRKTTTVKRYNNNNVDVGSRKDLPWTNNKKCPL